MTVTYISTALSDDSDICAAHPKLRLVGILPHSLQVEGQSLQGDTRVQELIYTKMICVIHNVHIPLQGIWRSLGCYCLLYAGISIFYRQPKTKNLLVHHYQPAPIDIKPSSFTFYHMTHFACTSFSCIHL